MDDARREMMMMNDADERNPGTARAIEEEEME